MAKKKTDLELDCMILQKYSSRHNGLKDGFLRPVYQYTSQENNFIEKLHENDYLKDWGYYD